MLVLSRTHEETIMIGDDVEVTVLDIRGDRVRLGIRAPSRIPVHRKEVYVAMQLENARAAQSDGAALGEATKIYGTRGTGVAGTESERE
jgi:carbon storage regulator